ncbi:MAG: hypothetical protein ACJAUV_001335 [Flavobacteriales bacterium]|jgi:hypothetical protein
MFTSFELTQINTKFWTVLGTVMKPHKSLSGSKVNWTNYNTKVKGMYFRLLAEKKSASVCFDFETKDEDIKELQLAQFDELKTMFRQTMPAEFKIKELVIDKRVITRFETTLENCSLFNESTWPTMFAFYKSHLIAFDIFWSDFKDLFLELK